jgi:undecaprenyl-diphosphatase
VIFAFEGLAAMRGRAGQDSRRGVWARGVDAVDRFDDSADRLFGRARGHRAIDRMMYATSALEEFGMVALSAAIVGPRRDRTWWPAARLGAAVAIESVVINVVVKSVFRRPRPVAEAPRPYPLRRPLTSSFPSAHAANAFCLATLLADDDRHLAPVYYAGATLVAVSRIYVQVHRASDVVGGIVTGLIWGHIYSRLVPVEPPQRGSPAATPASGA